MISLNGMERVGAVLAVFALAFVGLALATVPGPHSRPIEYQCQNNLKQIGGLLLAREAEGELRYRAGARFLHQVIDGVKTEDLKVFRCPAGPESRQQSYRGPDAFLLEVLRKDGTWPDGKSPIIACDANGPNGDEPHHELGVCVLYSTTKVEFIRWEDMEGYEGGPVRVGPGSPDPRFRHLVR